MEEKIRLRDVWPLLPENHAVSLRVKRPDRYAFYHARYRIRRRRLSVRTAVRRGYLDLRNLERDYRNNDKRK